MQIRSLCFRLRRVVVIHDKRKPLIFTLKHAAFPPTAAFPRRQHVWVHGARPIALDELLLLEVRLQVNDLPDGEHKEAHHREDAEVEHALVG